MTRASLLALLLLPAAVWGVPACSADESVDGLGTGTGADGVRVCTPNRQTACACMEGLGFRVCDADGSGWGDCYCGSGGSGPTGPCGDGVCLEEDDENCHTCTADCGACKPCDIAPACENTMIPPEQVSHQSDLDIPAMTRVTPEQLADRLAHEIATASPAMRLLVAALDPKARPDEHPMVTRLREVLLAHPVATDRLRAGLHRAGIPSFPQFRDVHPMRLGDGIELGAGTYTPRGNEFPLPMYCGAPMLRVGISEVIVHEDYDDVTNDKIYCVVQAEATAGGEIRVTPMTPPLDEGGASYVFSLQSSVFWGQQEPRDPEGNMQVTYDCVESDTDDGYANVLAAIGEAAVDVGGVIPGQAGWIVMIVGVVAQIVASVWAMDGDDPIFNAQHVISEELYYPMTRGVYWTVRRADDGGTFGSAFDWELIVKAWGCAEYGTLEAN